MWRDYKKEMALPVEREQAIFHFGISEFTGEMLGFTHISWDDFLPRRSVFVQRSECGLCEAHLHKAQ